MAKPLRRRGEGIHLTKIIRCYSCESMTKWDARVGHPDSKLMKPV